MKIAIQLLIALHLFCTAAYASSERSTQMTAEEVIQKLDLKPLPEEGGYFRETYRSNIASLSPQLFGINSVNPRTISTAIYYLVVPDSFSALHKVKSDEIFHFYGGDPVEMVQIDDQGNLQRFTIGNDIVNGEQPQVVVPRGVWQALRLKSGGKWSLMGTTVAPGFEFEDFELGDRETMIREFPQHREDITNFSREKGVGTH